MTCREKLAIEHPEKIVPDAAGGCIGCPWEYKYLAAPSYCGDHNLCLEARCGRCWDREIPGEGDTETTLVEKPHILDSGNRTVFESGAVRDIQEGKGRCDLLPLDVVAEYLNDAVLGYIANFQQDGDILELYNALDAGCDVIICSDFPKYHMLLEVSIHYEEGAKKYDENNWKKGIPVKRYIDSAVRHYLKFLRGDTDERHDRAFCWNIMGAIWTCKYMPELNEYRKVEVP